MTITATGVQSSQTTTSSPPPPPSMTPIQQGDVASGRAGVVDGHVFSIGDRSAPPTATWGDQPAGSPYRQTFDAVAARLGTSDRAAVTAEIDSQLYGTQPATSFAGVSASGTAQVQDGEGVGSFFEGAIKGDLGNNSSWSALAGQTVVGFIPVVGQIADIRDTGAAIGQVIRGEEGGWTALGAAAIGWIPGIGDAAKGGIRAADNVVNAGVDVARRSADDVAGRATTAADRLGISEADVNRIIDTPRGQRPDPSTYMSPGAIDAHLAPFQASGAVRFTRTQDVSDYGTLGPPGGTFAIPRSELDNLVEETGGDLTQIEQRLGLDAGSLTSGETMAAYIAPEDLRGLRVPSGNELGANDFWVPGGYTSGGMPEATIDTPADVPYSVITFGE